MITITNQLGSSLIFQQSMTQIRHKHRHNTV